MILQKTVERLHQLIDQDWSKFDHEELETINVELIGYAFEDAIK
ncbi:hypothetical protein [Paenibacillus pabuli]|nr:hypothetical protein [Paenibacillus pabuli]MEC0124149.1 hypothetical protein [Paenibacillus pabuli]